eukprot:CAMPEP_0113942554 /NCGR_PEP_ID=MMETSP1339-20121228/8247_1 /TAXON_ID=94617 /ORGANISM="Fibrocapsa japonica" /LENGTH=393 /DNA_ID=CAMNT_0000947073 /DNA_START=24 /DNA_END=1205 /DNA_ORIENTATION=+ /assembly_acc=CAM_ASM_000762
MLPLLPKCLVVIATITSCHAFLFHSHKPLTFKTSPVAFNCHSSALSRTFGTGLSIFATEQDQEAQLESQDAVDLNKDNSRTEYKVEEWLESFRGQKIAAVYLVKNSNNKSMFVGTTNDLALSLGTHLATHGPLIVTSVQYKSYVSAPTPEEMEADQREWIRGLGKAPLGNSKAGQALWQTPVAQAVEASESAPAQSPQEAQSKGTDIVSPFAAEDDEESDDEEWVADEEESFETPKPSVTNDLEFTKENVDKVLDEVRPYLIADGGNVEVVDVLPDTGEVQLALQGACGTCPSSTMTMKMGIERVLRENFSALTEVVQVEDPALAGQGELTIDVVDAVLDKIRPAILGMGGCVRVVSSTGGNVVLEYEGPPKIKYGIEMSLKDNTLVKDVKFI